VFQKTNLYNVFKFIWEAFIFACIVVLVYKKYCDPGVLILISVVYKPINVTNELLYKIIKKMEDLDVKEKDI